MCADGYLPVVIDGEPTNFTEPWYIEWEYNSAALEYDYTRETPVRHFTCCPPNDDALSLEARNGNRKCSDPIIAPSNSTGICEGQGTRKYPIQMNTRGYLGAFLPDFSSFLCCDSDENQNDTTSFINDTECIPYHFDEMFHYYNLRFPNVPAKYSQAACYGEFGSNFPVPRPLDNATLYDFDTSYKYQCCRSGTPLPPYVQDTTFWTTTAIPFAFFCISAIASLFVMMGLGFPLLTQLVTGTYESGTSNTRRGTNRGSASSGRNRGSSSGRRAGSPSYSTYNLYLVYLAFPDFFISTCMLVFYGLQMNQSTKLQNTFEYLFFNFTLPPAYTLANLWMNAVVLYQVMIMLRATDNVQRIDQPSLMRANLQAAAVYLLAGGIATHEYYCSYRRYWNPDPETRDKQYRKEWLPVYLPLVFLPILYGMYAGIMVYRRGYLRATGNQARSRARRTLAVFFFRIVAVFVVIWAPAIILRDAVQRNWAIFTYNLLVSIQPIGTTFAIMTKEDVRKYISDFVTLSYCFGERKNGKKKNETTVLTTNASSQPGGSLHVGSMATSLNNSTQVEDEEGGQKRNNHSTRSATRILPTGEMVSSK